MKTIEEMNSFDDIDNYYEAEIPQFIQEILEERVEALKHCITYKKEIERLHSIIKEVREYAIDNQFTAHLDIQTNKVTKIENGEMTDILEILDKENKQ